MNLSDILAELEIVIVPLTKQRGARETFADNTMVRILAEHGAGHLRSVLMSIVETGDNSKMLIAPVIWAISDVLLAHPSWFGSGWLDALDKIDLSDMHERAKANRQAAQPRQAIATMLFEQLRERMPVNVDA